ncbi:MAG: Holliday junction resolvase RuvX [Eggerthellaceae bacterium]|nr:Holliday junction resolvase RuvX [Eggerthellaceae bacterium]
MRVMALDIGEKRIGIAISDPDERVATPLSVLDASQVERGEKAFKRLLEDWEPELFLVGLPLTLHGEEGPQSLRIRSVASGISARFGIPVEYSDERLSSREAKRILREEGLSEREMRGKIDMIAANVFLQAWLDEKASDNADASAKFAGAGTTIE